MKATVSSPIRPPVRELMAGLQATMLGFRQMTVTPLLRVGVTPAQFWVMKHLSETGELACGPLATKLGVTMPSVTSLVGPLETAGFVRRVRSTEDRRVVRLELTPRGAGLLARVWKEFEREVSSRIQDLPSSDVRAAARVLAALGARAATIAPVAGAA